MQLLHSDPDVAVEAAAAGLDLGDALADEPSLIEAFRPMLSSSDLKVLENPLYARAFLDEVREASRGGKLATPGTTWPIFRPGSSIPPASGVPSICGTATRI